MAVAPAIDLTAGQRRTVLALLSRYLPNTTVWAYGSRVKWTSRPASDLDLVAFAEPEQAACVAELREAFDDGDLPFRVDLFVWDDVPSGFRKHIEAEHVVLTKNGCRRKKWPRMTLGSVTQLTLSSVDKKTQLGEEPVRLCNYMDVYSNRYIRPNLDFMTATATTREIERCSLQPGDVVITKDSEQHDDIGVPALVHDSCVDALVCGYHLALLRPQSDSVLGSYLLYALQTKDVRHQFSSYANGVTRFSLRKDDILRVEIPLPPLPEQRAIARILGALDDKIELNRRMIETAERMARTTFESWFRGQCSVSPNMARLDDLIDVNPAYHLGQGDIAPYLDMANTPMRTHVPHAAPYRSYRSGTRFQNGDTLVARITPCLENGKAAYVDFLKEGEVGWGSTEFIVMRPRHPIPHEFAYCLARDESFRQFAILNMTGTSGRQRVSAESLAAFPMAVPSPTACRQFGQCARPLFSKARAAAFESRSLASLRDTLLPKLISGEIQLADAEEEIGAVV